MAKVIKRPASAQELPFGKKNLYILGIGLAVLVIGFAAGFIGGIVYYYTVD